MASATTRTDPSYRHMNVMVAPGSPAEKACMGRVLAARAAAGEQGLLLPNGAAPPLASAAAGLLPSGIDPSPAENLVDRGGRIIPNLTFTNFFVGGAESWDASDIGSIDKALAAAMSDRDLNNVMVQYFRGGSITSTFKPSTTLPGPAPQTVSKGDLEAMVRALHGRDTFRGFDLPSTVFNFMLPRGTVLTTDLAPTAQAGATARAEATTGPRKSDLTDDDEDSSVDGLGGYHGSINVAGAAGTERVYYAVGVFSERRDDGTVNGIPAFDQPWKSVVATFYHELNEARTDPDVEEAIRNNDDSLIGWNSDRGQECGDFPIEEAGGLNDLSLVFQEVALTDGTGTVPVQFQYSNFAQGPQGPSTTPDPAQT